jgi:hypothetical protein
MQEEKRTDIRRAIDCDGRAKERLAELTRRRILSED